MHSSSDFKNNKLKLETLSSLSDYLDLAARSVSLASLKVNCCRPNIGIGQVEVISKMSFRCDPCISNRENSGR